MNQFISRHKHHLLIFALLLIIVCVSGYATFSNTTTALKHENIKTQKQTNTSSLNNNITTSPTDNKYQIPVIKKNSTTTEQGDNTTNQLPITYYKLQASEYQLSLPPTSTAYDLMMLAAVDSRRPFLFKTKEFPGMGYFVEEINGVKNDQTAGKYWIYYINGKSAQVGISNYILKLNDIIEWKYETANL